MVDTSNWTNPCALADPTSQHLKPQIKWGSLSYAIQLEFPQRWQSGPLDHTVWSIVASVSLLSQEVFRAETTSYQTFAQVFLLHLIYDVGWSISPTCTPQNPNESHDWSSFSPRRWSGSYHVAFFQVRQNHWSTSMVFSPKIEYEYPRNHCFPPIRYRNLLKDLEDFRVSHGLEPTQLEVNVDQERCEAMALSRDRQMMRKWGHAEAMNHPGYYCYGPHLVKIGDYIGTWKG